MATRHKRSAYELALEGELKKAKEDASRTQQFYDALVEQRDKLNELSRTLAAERDAARLELHECHAVFDKLERREAGRMFWESSKTGSLIGRLALFLASIRA